MSDPTKMIDWCLNTADQLDSEPRLGKEADHPESKGHVRLSIDKTKKLAAGLREAAATLNADAI